MAILQHGPTEDDGYAAADGHIKRARWLFFLEVYDHTDGSATMVQGWPQLGAQVGWSAVVFAIDEHGNVLCLGALWGPIEVAGMPACSNISWCEAPHQPRF